MTMKKIFILLLLCIFLTGCAATPSYFEYEGRFIVVEHMGFYKIIADSQTRVCYLAYGDYAHSGLTVMVDMDGNPILYDGVLPR